MRKFIRLLSEAASEWSEDNAMKMSAALAYYAVLSLGPLLIVIIAIAGAVFGEHGASERVAEEIRQIVGARAGDAMLALVRSANQGHSTTAVFGVLVLLLSASGVFGELKTTMNIIWGVVARPGRSIFAIIFERLISFGIVVLAGVVVIVALAASALLSSIESSVNGILPLPKALLQIADFSITFTIISALFVAIFLFLPDVRIRLADVWASAVGTALLFTLGKFLIGIYLGKSKIASSFGAAGSVMVVQLWVYYSAGILFFGAELAKVVTRWRRGQIVPRRNAIRVEDAMRQKIESQAKQ